MCLWVSLDQQLVDAAGRCAWLLDCREFGGSKAMCLAGGCFAAALPADAACYLLAHRLQASHPQSIPYPSCGACLSAGPQVSQAEKDAFTKTLPTYRQ